MEQASAIPAALYWVLWISVFCALIWGFQVLLGGNRTPPPPGHPDDNPDSDLSLEPTAPDEKMDDQA